MPTPIDMVIAIDGPAGSGKSTLARGVAAALGLAHLDTGAMYRAVAARALVEGVDPEDGESLTEIAEYLIVSFTPAGMTVDGRPAGPELRTPEVDKVVSAVSAHPGVRRAMVRHQRRIMEHGAIVAEGRDIGTVVFPEAPVKIFLTATDEARARRRLADHDAAGHAIELAELLAELRRRDELDSTREHSPLIASEDAIVIDTTDLSIDEMVAEVARIARAVMAEEA